MNLPKINIPWVCINMGCLTIIPETKLFCCDKCRDEFSEQKKWDDFVLKNLIK
jgi:predicted nucleic acid-binding Zn ribbon protein